MIVRAASHFFCHFVKFSCHFVKFSIFVIFLSKTFCFVKSYLYLCSDIFLLLFNLIS